MHENFFQFFLLIYSLYDEPAFLITRHTTTVQLTGNVAGTRTTRHASTREPCEGTGSPRGTANKTKTTRELNYSQFIRKTSLKGPGTIMIQPIHKIRVTDYS